MTRSSIACAATPPTCWASRAAASCVLIFPVITQNILLTIKCELGSEPWTHGEESDVAPALSGLLVRDLSLGTWWH